jgi:hypothetical protein
MLLSLLIIPFLQTTHHSLTENTSTPNLIEIREITQEQKTKKKRFRLRRNKRTKAEKDARKREKKLKKIQKSRKNKIDTIGDIKKNNIVSIADIKLVKNQQKLGSFEEARKLLTKKQELADIDNILDKTHSLKNKKLIKSTAKASFGGDKALAKKAILKERTEERVTLYAQKNNLNLKEAQSQVTALDNVNYINKAKKPSKKLISLSKKPKKQQNIYKKSLNQENGKKYLAQKIYNPKMTVIKTQEFQKTTDVKGKVSSTAPKREVIEIDVVRANNQDGESFQDTYKRLWNESIKNTEGKNSNRMQGLKNPNINTVGTINSQKEQKKRKKSFM